MNAQHGGPDGYQASAPSDVEQPYVRTQDPNLAAYAEEFLDAVDELPTLRPTVGCIIPAYNEAETIAGVLDSLLQQTRLPDVVHLVIKTRATTRSRSRATTPARTPG